jgi:ribosomal protein L11 methyltransferase
MPWLEFSVEVDLACVEAVEDFFLEQGAQAVTIRDLKDEAIFEPAIGSAPRWQLNKVTALLDADSKTETLFEELKARFQNQAPETYKVEALEDRDWEREWLKHYQSMCFADTLWIMPSLYEQDETILKEEVQSHHVVLKMDPGLAFGTGTHETTHLCLDWLASNKPTGKRVIDYGCGSGILGIAAKLLSADTVYACDIDPQALQASKDNAARNQVKSGFIVEGVNEFNKRVKALPKKADILLANILAGPLQKLCPELAKLLDSGATIILSGILYTQHEAILSCYEAFFKDFEVTRKNDWVRIVATRK